ncbi:MAG: methyltransferase [Oscillospiraceae bacterium]|nr:methyltransferase [Oscillospiraceae bacterium]
MNEIKLWPQGPVMLQNDAMKLTGDSVLLADFTPVRKGEKGADLGCGSGVLMLLLLWREKSLRMTGIELQPQAAALAEENFRRNGLSERARVLRGDYRDAIRQLPNGGFDFVIANPPYFTLTQGALSPDAGRAAARGETASSLTELCTAASRLCRSGGKICFSFRAERLPELLREMSAAHLEPKRLRFVHHTVSSGASVVLAEGRKDGKPGIRVEAPFILRDADGQETEEYRRVCHR